MPIERSSRRIPSARLEREARSLLRASALCAIASISPGGRAHVNTAYFAHNTRFEIVWLSAPEARHSRNVRDRGSVAIAVFDSTQTWGKPDRGIQLFGRARECRGRDAAAARRLYRLRFRSYAGDERSTYRFYRFRPTEMKLFDERRLGGGTFVTASVARNGVLRWRRSEVASEQE
jgi:uncharacterized protein YhbP (UPF0306 family)